METENIGPEYSPKSAALKLIERMPDDTSLEDIMYHLYFRQRIDRGMDELDRGLSISHDDVKGNLKDWLLSSGQ